MSTLSKTIISFVVVIALAGGIYIYLMSNKSGLSVATTANDTAVDTSGQAAGTTTAGNTTGTPKYKDGTYTAQGTYQSPAGTEGITVSLTLKNDIVTDATVTPGANDPMSQRYQGKFISGYKAQVIGKDISTIHLDKVSGSSLTPGGFDQALASIETQAQA